VNFYQKGKIDKENKQTLSESYGLGVCMISDDKNNIAKAKERGLLALSTEQWIRNMPESDEVDLLFDLISKAGMLANDTDDADQNNLPGDKKILEQESKTDHYPKHLPLSQIQQGIKSGKLIQGKININPDNNSVGKIMNDTHGTILVQGLQNLNRAIDCDQVCVKFLPEEEWIGEIEEFNDLKSAPSVENPPKNAKIVGIVKRNWRQYCGMIDTVDGHNTKSTGTKGEKPEAIDLEGRKVLFLPADAKLPRIEIETRQVNKLIGNRILVAIDGWPRTSEFPIGHFIKSLGKIGDKNAEKEVILLEHSVPHESFSEAVKQCLPPKNWQFDENNPKHMELAVGSGGKRMDLRHLPVCSVDPPGCTDIDDTLHCVTVPGQPDWSDVGVHIADVSHFIKPGTAIDEEARNRGTTVYLCDDRIDMVPTLLSGNLCSMRDDGDRLGFTVMWRINNKTAEIDHSKTVFTKSVIKSRKSLTYEAAQLRIDDPTMNDEITVGLRGLNTIAKLLKAKRLEKGALTLSSAEVRFTQDSETHDPIDLQTKELRETNSMVEEFMLLANISVAEKIHHEFPEVSVLRRHPTPPASNFDSLLNAAKTKGIHININNSKSLADSLDEAEIDGDKYIQTLLRILATRCMYQAVYFCTGLESDFRHYGLAAEIYTHFTSPIRRYADILVHRLLAAAIGQGETNASLMDKKKIKQTCDHINKKNRAAQYASRASVKLHTLLFFRGKTITKQAFIINVKKTSVTVIIPEYGLEGLVNLIESYDKSYHFKEDDIEYSQEDCYVIVNNHKLSIFDKCVIKIFVDSSNIQNEKIIMSLVEPDLCVSYLEPKRKKMKV